jgi:hypothetical protein
MHGPDTRPTLGVRTAAASLTDEQTVFMNGSNEDDTDTWMKAPLTPDEQAAVDEACLNEPSCPICKRHWRDQPGTIYCGAQHGECGICGKPRCSRECRCLTTPIE